MRVQVAVRRVRLGEEGRLARPGVLFPPMKAVRSLDAPTPSFIVGIGRPEAGTFDLNTVLARST